MTWNQFLLVFSYEGWMRGRSGETVREIMNPGVLVP